MNPISLITPTATLALLLQASTNIPVASGFPLEAIRDLTLTSFCILVIWVLWGTLKSKDDQISKMNGQMLEMATNVTKTMALVMEAVKELRMSTDDVVKTVSNVSNVLDRLAAEIEKCPKVGPNNKDEVQVGHSQKSR